ncbi:MAG: hypothetical protein V4692_03570 [Bdellovibrionota bacterium]
MKLDAYGKKLEVLHENGQWVIYLLSEGKRVRSNDLVIPSEFTKEEVISYLEDLLHEAATPENPKIKILG